MRISIDLVYKDLILYLIRKFILQELSFIYRMLLYIEDICDIKSHIFEVMACQVGPVFRLLFYYIPFCSIILCYNKI